MGGARPSDGLDIGRRTSSGKVETKVGEEAHVELRQNTPVYNTGVPSMEHAGQGVDPLSGCAANAIAATGAFHWCECRNLSPSWLKSTLRMIRVAANRFVFLLLTVANIPKTRFGLMPLKKNPFSQFFRFV